VERLIPGRDRQLAVIAPHGGDIEEHTDEQAQRVAVRLGAAARWSGPARDGVATRTPSSGGTLRRPTSPPSRSHS
jgi:hypothetical protein